MGIERVLISTAAKNYMDSPFGLGQKGLQWAGPEAVSCDWIDLGEAILLLAGMDAWAFVPLEARHGQGFGCSGSDLRRLPFVDSQEGRQHPTPFVFVR